MVVFGAREHAALPLVWIVVTTPRSKWRQRTVVPRAPHLDAGQGGPVGRLLSEENPTELPVIAQALHLFFLHLCEF